MIEIIKDDRIPDFCHKTQYSAGYDLYACLDHDIVVEPMQTVLVPTGIRVNMMHDPNSFAMVVPRSGMSLKTNLRICNAPGTIDMDYIGEIKIIIQNISQHSNITIKPLDRIAQLIFAHFGNSSLDFVKEFSNKTERGSNGFGSTGK